MVRGLRELHRVGLVVPMFRVGVHDGDSYRVVDVSGSRHSQHTPDLMLSELYRAAIEGRISDPAAVPTIRGYIEKIRA